MREVLSELLRCLSAGRPSVLCTLVETKGSTPQKAGATMLVHPDGSQSGTLGGGCVEAEVKQRALRAAGGERPALHIFHLDDDYGWDDGLICGGRMTILAQPANSACVELIDYVHTLHGLHSHGHGGVEVVCLEAFDGLAAGSRFLFDHERRICAALGGASPPAVIQRQIEALPFRPRPASRDGLAFLPILPRITLLIVGAGHVGQAVAALAAQADFEVVVLDDREQFANRARFPDAQRLIVGAIGRELAQFGQLGISASTYAIIVTRGHNHDEEALYHLASSKAGYVGMIGSKRKIRLIFDDLLAKGVATAALSRVHAPLGLDIGSQTVPEIAVSIVAELIAHRNRGSVVGSLRQSARSNESQA